MPTYTFKCECGEYWEKFLLFKEFDLLGQKKQVDCPKCLCKDKVAQTFDDAPDSHIKGEITTIGQLGEANAKKMGKTRLQEAQAKKDAKMAPKRKKPWYGQLDKKKAKELGLGTDKQQAAKIKKYIMEGE